MFEKRRYLGVEPGSVGFWLNDWVRVRVRVRVRKL